MPASGFSHVTEQDERLRRRSIIQRVIEEQTFRKSPDLDDPEPIETPVEDDSSLTIEDLVHNDPSDRLELSERRMSRRERNELDIRMSQMSECTFEPTIHELPRHYGIQRDVDIPFHLRMDRWAKRKEAWQTQVLYVYLFISFHQLTKVETTRAVAIGARRMYVYAINQSGPSFIYNTENAH